MKTVIVKRIWFALMMSLVGGHAWANNCPNYSYTPSTGLANGATADASQVWSNFSTVMDCISFYIGGTTSGTASAQVLSSVVPATTSLILTPGNRVTFVSNFNTTGPTTLAVAGLSPVNVVKKTIAGTVPLGLYDMIANQVYTVQYDGSQFQLLDPTPAPAAQPIAALARSVSLAQSAPLSSGTFNAVQVVVSSSLGSSSTSALLNSYSQVLTVSGTGAGGMDTGTPPASGFLDIYAIYNPSGPTTSILGCADMTCGGTWVYSGANMPSGYTQSALLGIVPTDAVGDIQAGLLTDRQWCNKTYVNIFTNVNSGRMLSQSISSAVPPTARHVWGYIGITGTTVGAGGDMEVASDSNHTAGQLFMSVGGTSAADSGLDDPNFGYAQSFGPIPITTPQTLYYTNVAHSTGTRMDVTCYDF